MTEPQKSVVRYVAALWFVAALGTLVFVLTAEVPRVLVAAAAWCGGLLTASIYRSLFVTGAPARPVE